MRLRGGPETVGSRIRTKRRKKLQTVVYVAMYTYVVYVYVYVDPVWTFHFFQNIAYRIASLAYA